MANPTYTQLTTPLTRAQVLDSQLSVLSGPDFNLPVASWTTFDEPYATLAADAQVLADLSTTIAGIAKAGVTSDAASDSLTIHAKDVYDVTRQLGVATKGNVTLSESAGNPQAWAAGGLIFAKKTDASITFRNTGAVTLAANGAVTFEIAADQVGSSGNVQASDLQLSTQVPGVSMSAAGGTAWVTQSGTDNETDERLRARCAAKWSTLTSTGPTGAYTKWALDASASVNRVNVIEDAAAVYPTAAVTVVLAGPTGAVGSAVISTVAAYLEDGRRPLGIKVSVVSAGVLTFELAGPIVVKASKRAAAEAYINSQLDAWFAGTSITINGDTVPGLQIGDTILISQIIEVVMSAPGVISFTPKNGAGVVYVPGTGDVPLFSTTVAVLSRGGLTYTETT